MTSNPKDQQHPQESRDCETVEKLLQGQPDNPYDLAELARLRIRYCNFPGARKIQRDLDLVLQQWQLTEAELFEKTREIHTAAPAYKLRNSRQDAEDWS